MDLQIFSVYDDAAEAYLPPFYTPTIGLALRSFTEAADDPSHQFNKHPGSYTLFHLGAFNDSNCSFAFLQNPNRLGSALELRTRAANLPKSA